MFSKFYYLGAQFDYITVVANRHICVYILSNAIVLGNYEKNIAMQSFFFRSYMNFCIRCIYQLTSYKVQPPPHINAQIKGATTLANAPAFKLEATTLMGFLQLAAGGSPLITKRRQPAPAANHEHMHVISHAAIICECAWMDERLHASGCKWLREPTASQCFTGFVSS